MRACVCVCGGGTEVAEMRLFGGSSAFCVTRKRCDTRERAPTNTREVSWLGLVNLHSAAGTCLIDSSHSPYLLFPSLSLPSSIAFSSALLRIYPFIANSQVRRASEQEALVHVGSASVGASSSSARCILHHHHPVSSSLQTVASVASDYISSLPHCKPLCIGLKSETARSNAQSPHSPSIWIGFPQSPSSTHTHAAER